MPLSDEVVCAIADTRGDAEVVRFGALLAEAMGLRLVLVHVVDPERGMDGPSERELESALRSSRYAAGDARFYEGRLLPVLQGLGRALCSSWLLLGDGGKPMSDALAGPTTKGLMATDGCPLAVVSATHPFRRGGTIARVLDRTPAGDTGDVARRLAEALGTSMVLGHDPQASRASVSVIVRAPSRRAAACR